MMMMIQFDAKWKTESNHIKSDFVKKCIAGLLMFGITISDDIVKSPSISVFKKRLSGVKFDRFLTVTEWLYVF